MAAVDSSIAYLQTDADFAGFIVGEVNVGLPGIYDLPGFARWHLRTAHFHAGRAIP